MNKRCLEKKTVILLILSFLSTKNCFSQGTDSGFVSVKVHVIGKGVPPFYKFQLPAYYTMATVTNNQDTAIIFWVMTCSWPTYNWKCDNDSIHFRLLSNGCDANFPDEIILQPHKSVNFYGTLVTYNAGQLVDINFKLGFRYFLDMRDIDEFLTSKSGNSHYKTFWSDQSKLEDHLFKYQIE